MATPETDHQALQVVHEFDGTTYSLTFVEPTSGRVLTTIALPTTQMVALVQAIAHTMGGTP